VHRQRRTLARVDGLAEADLQDEGQGEHQRADPEVPAGAQLQVAGDRRPERGQQAQVATPVVHSDERLGGAAQEQTGPQALEQHEQGGDADQSAEQGAAGRRLGRAGGRRHSGTPSRTGTFLILTAGRPPHA
jgi:hypothetical protein